MVRCMYEVIEGKKKECEIPKILTNSVKSACMHCMYVTWHEHTCECNMYLSPGQRRLRRSCRSSSRWVGTTRRSWRRSWSNVRLGTKSCCQTTTGCAWSWSASRYSRSIVNRAGHVSSAPVSDMNSIFIFLHTCTHIAAVRQPTFTTSLPLPLGALLPATKQLTAIFVQ